jgi:hypothetical protein
MLKAVASRDFQDSMREEASVRVTRAGGRMPRSAEERVLNEKSLGAFSEKGAADLHWLLPEEDLTRLRVCPGGREEVWSELGLSDGGGCMSTCTCSDMLTPAYKGFSLFKNRNAS